MPSAASVAEYCVSLPALIAAARNASICAAGACVAALTADIALSKSAADFTAAPAIPSRPRPTTPAVSATLSRWPPLAALSSSPLKSRVDCEAAFSFAW
jgi:hypothetical protein